MNLVIQRLMKFSPIAFNFRADRALRGLFVQVDDQRLAAGAQHAMHFAECRHRFAKVLEGRAAEEEVECVVVERHSRDIALDEFDRHARLLVRCCPISTNDRLMSSVCTRGPSRANSMAK